MTSKDQRIDHVVVPDGGGRIGMIACPGRRGWLGALGWGERTMRRDLEAIRGWGAAGIISLIEVHEFETLGVVDLPQVAEETGLWWHHLPIRDMWIPNETFEQHWKEVCADLHRHLGGGGRFVIHCWAGLGRTGTIAARLLIERGVRPNQAIREVREARAGAIQTAEQETYLLRGEPFTPLPD